MAARGAREGLWLEQSAARKGLSSQHDAHVRAARNSDRSPRKGGARGRPVRARAVRAKCSLAGLTTQRAILVCQTLPGLPRAARPPAALGVLPFWSHERETNTGLARPFTDHSLRLSRRGSRF